MGEGVALCHDAFGISNIDGRRQFPGSYDAFVIWNTDGRRRAPVDRMRSVLTDLSPWADRPAAVRTLLNDECAKIYRYTERPQESRDRTIRLGTSRHGM